MICFIGFLSDEFKFFNLKNPFYPSLQQWMQMDASTFEVTAVLSDIQTCTKDIENKPENINENINENIEKEGNKSTCQSLTNENPALEIKNETSTSLDTNNNTKIASLVSSENSSIQKHTKAKKRTLLTPKRNGLKNRKDVVNKSLLRAMRRFFVVEWNQIKPALRTKSQFKRIKLFDEAIKLYVLRLVSSESHNENIKEEMNITYHYSESELEELNEIIGCFVHKENYLNALKQNHQNLDYEVQHFLENIDRCCRSYSHIQFEELVKVH